MIIENQAHSLEDQIIGGIVGVVTADALGLPVQFLSRDEVRRKPVAEMRGYGTFSMPPGTWSDDSSMTLCLTESLTEKGYDLYDIADRFVRWYRDGYCTPHGRSFDIGQATDIAMRRLILGAHPLNAGPIDEQSNGNGSLMRILPAAIYFSHLPDPELVVKVSEVSRITHGHSRSLLGCSLYALLIKELLAGVDREQAYRHLCQQAPVLFNGTALEKELGHYSRLLSGSLPALRDHEIQSSGYIVHTLEAAIWCFMQTDSYRDAILKAVNLGLDTDSIGSATGGLAGVCYGLSGIPEEWVATLVKNSEITQLARRFAHAAAGS